MVQKESHTDRTEKSSSSNPMPVEFAEMAKKRVDEFVNMQAELLGKLQETTVNGLNGRNQRQIWRLNLPQSSWRLDLFRTQ